MAEMADTNYTKCGIRSKWSRMKESKRQRAKQEFMKMDDFVVRGYRENPDAYIVDFFTRKAKAENSSLVYGVIAALAINLTLQFLTDFVYSVSAEVLSSDLVFALKVVALASNFVFLGLSIAIVYIYYYFNQKQKKQLLLEEYLLRKHKFIS